MRIDKDELKERLTIDDVAQILTDFGGEVIEKDDEVLVSRTICHNHAHGEASHKLYYYHENKIFSCYTNCGTFDIFDLVSKAYETQNDEELSFVSSMHFIMNKLGLSTFDFSESERSDTHELLELVSRITQSSENAEDKELKEYKTNLLNHLKQPLIRDWYLEGITKDTTDKFNIAYYPSDAKIVIPHYDKNNRLVGIRGRALVYEDAEKYGKYMPLQVSGKMYNHPLGFNLYGLNVTKDNIQRVRTAIIFESEKSVMLAEEYMPSNISVAVCGSNISDFQMSELMKLGVEEVIIGFDRQYREYGDDDCLKWEQKIKRIADRYKNYINISVIFDKEHLVGYKDAPIDCGKDVFYQLLGKRIPVL